MLAPGVPADFITTFEAHFKGMRAEPVEIETLLDIRESLLVRLAGWLGGPSCAFLRSMRQEDLCAKIMAVQRAISLCSASRGWRGRDSRLMIFLTLSCETPLLPAGLHGHRYAYG